MGNSDPDPLLNEYSVANSTFQTPPLEPVLLVLPLNQPHPCPANSSHFKTLATDSYIEEAKKSVPMNTDKNTSWAVNIWKQWSAHRCQTCASYSDWPTHLMIAYPTEMNYWLCKFVLEVNGDHCSPDTLYCIFSSLFWFVTEIRSEINIFKDPAFTLFQWTLNSEKKRLHLLGLGVKRKQSEPITMKEGYLLWERGLLGDSSPQALLDTMLFLSSIHFALHSGEEHCSLQLSQFESIVPKDKSAACLVYTENYSKTNQGCLQLAPQGTTNVRYILRQWKQPWQVSSSSLSALHQSSSYQFSSLLSGFTWKKRDDVWYSKVPVGHNTLSQTVWRLCKLAGITGFKTNHSLQVTSATRLFQSGIDEWLIMSHTALMVFTHTSE